MKHRKGGRGPQRSSGKPHKGQAKAQAKGRSGRHGGPQLTRRPAGVASGRMEGVVSPHRSGFGFVKVEGQEQNVFLPPPQLAGLTAGDRVRMRVREDATGRLAGEVEAVLARGVSAFLGTLEAAGRTLFVHAVNRRLNLRCLVPPGKSAGARPGDWVIARVTRYPDGHSGATAEVLR